MSVDLRDRLRPLDFRYHPRATGDVWRYNMSRGAMCRQCEGQKIEGLFDHLISLSEQRWRNYKTECLGGIHVDH